MSDRLPTREEIAELPLRARVAFAARCARRALPMFAMHWLAAPDKYTRAVEHAVDLAEVYASGVAAAADVAADDAARAFAADDAARAFADAAGAAAFAAGAADDAGVMTSLIVADFAAVRTAAIRGKWGDKTPVPPTTFGPISEPEAAVDVPDSAPVPQSELRSPLQLKLQVYRSATATDDVVGEKLVELYEKLNEYYLAKYGTWFTEKQFEQFIHTGAIDPVPTGGC